MIPEELPPNAIDSIAERDGVKSLEIAGRKVLKLSFGEEQFLVAQLSPNTICIANHPGFLSEVIQLANAQGKQQRPSIEENPAFQTALSLVSPSAKFWGVRMFCGDDAQDPTSLRNAHNVWGMHDPRAIYVAMELSNVESSSVQFYYASEDSVAATKQFPERIELSVEIARSHEPTTIHPENGKPDYVVNAMKADLSKWKIAAMDEPSILFLALCTVFGQGMLL